MSASTSYLKRKQAKKWKQTNTNSLLYYLDFSWLLWKKFPENNSQWYVHDLLYNSALMFLKILKMIIKDNF